MNEEQIAFLSLYLVYFALSVILVDSVLVKPIRLLTTFVHEFSHALACWMTGGSVRGIEVHSNAGGVTKYVGGCRCIIASAGYLGEAFWGMMFVILSGGRLTSTVAASGLVVALLISLCYAPNRTMVYLNLCYAVLLLGFIYAEWFIFTPLLNYIVLFYGVFWGFFAIADIHSHTVLRSMERSDAYTLYEESGRCCLPRCIGTWWLFIAISLQILGLWIALILLSDECDHTGWIECVFHTNVDDLKFDWNWDWN